MVTIIRDAGSGLWRVFERPLEVVAAHHPDEVLPALRAVELSCRQDGRHAAGFISYEAAPGFDSALRTRPADGFPLLWFGLFDAPNEVSLEELRQAAPTQVSSGPWEPSISAAQYADVFRQLQEWIHGGDTYQVNFTYRLRCRFAPDPYSFFLQLAGAQRPPFGAYIDTGEWIVCCGSPELFFHRTGSTIESRPMKGTAPRGLWFEQDLDLADRLRRSAKERAENVMIVDMVRNDLGRIAKPGSVQVTNLFDVERHPTVLQLTSTVVAETEESLSDVIAALFPAASITGAPKSRTMEIIAGVECSPRRIYTGTIGFIEPGGRAQFNVAIRTLLLNRATGEAEYGVGGGIVADSDRERELEESRLKSRALEPPPPAFDLLETLLWAPAEGYVLLSRHLTRLLQSADYFGYPLDLHDIRRQLAHMAEGLGNAPHRIRLRVSRRGAVRLEAQQHDPLEGFGPVALAAVPVDAANPFLYHKTTNRQVYQQAMASRPAFSDVLLYNARNELTESTIANLIVEIGGELFTPPISSGLLPGTARAQLLEDGRVRERVIAVDEALASTALYLVNSVRGLHRVTVDYRSVLTSTGL